MLRKIIKDTALWLCWQRCALENTWGFLDVPKIPGYILEELRSLNKIGSHFHFILMR